MNTVVDLIKQNSDRHQHFEQYFAVIETAEQNKHANPDICIESCKSLIEGVSKTILVNLDPTKTFGNIDDDDLTTIFKAAVKKLGEKSADFEPDFAGRFGSIIHVLGEIRNKRGDISHGRVAPKQVFSSAQLAASMTQMTAGIVVYLLEHYYRLPLSMGEFDYGSDVMAPYNEWLDESIKNFPIAKTRYSVVLFEKDYDAYKAIYEDEYLPSLEPEKIAEAPQEPVPEEPVKVVDAPKAEQPAEPKKRATVEVLSVNFDEEAFWTSDRMEEVRAFAEKEEFDFERMHQFINDYLAFEKPPRPDDLFSAYRGKMHRVKDWLIVRDEMMERLVPLLEKYDRESYEVLARKKAESTKGI